MSSTTTSLPPTSPPGGTLRRWRRSLVVAALLLPLAWIAFVRTEFETEIEIERTESKLIFTVNGRRQEAPLAGLPLTELVITATPCFFRQGGGEIVVSSRGWPVVRALLPEEFKFPPAERPLTSDWWIDSTALRAEVFKLKTNAPLPWKVRTTIYGRMLAEMEVKFDGGASCAFRSGLLNNDALIFDPERKPLAIIELPPDPARDSRHAVHGLVGGLFLACALYLLASALGTISGRKLPAWLERIPWSAFAWAMVLVGFALALWMAWSILAARPHFQDDLGYLTRAKWLCAGRLWLPPPPFGEHFAIPFTMVVKGRWMSHYPVGWPLLLALGEFIHQAWIVPPLCSLVAGAATYFLTRESAGVVAATMAVTLLALSPLNVVLSGSMLSHAATAMWLALFACLYLRGWRDQGRPRSLLLAGVALGMAFSTRPLSGVAVGAVAGAFAVAELVRHRLSVRSWKLLAVFGLGGVAGSLPALLDNWFTTGNPLTFAYNLNYSHIWKPGMDPGGLLWTDRMLGQFPSIAFGWGWPAAWGTSWIVLALVFAFALVPFVAGRATREDSFLLGIFVLVALSYIGFSAGTGLHGFGPRYYVDIFFALAVLSARGFQVLATAPARAPAALLPVVVVATLFAVLTGSTAGSLPRRLELYRNYNEIDDRIEKAIARLPEPRALVLLGDPAYLNWVRAARLLNRDLRAPLVFAELREDNSALLEAYRGWPVYQFDGQGLRPFPPPAEGSTPP